MKRVAGASPLCSAGADAPGEHALASVAGALTQRMMQQRRFTDRTEAGRLLAERLREYAVRDDVVVLGLPRARPAARAC